MTQIGFWKRAQQNPNHIALITPNETKITAGELLKTSNQLVWGLRAMGLKPGDTIATVLDNHPAMIELYLAVAQAGWYLVPINHHLVATEIAYIIDDSTAKVVICSPTHHKTCMEALEKIALPLQRLYTTTTSDKVLRSYITIAENQPDSTPTERSAGGVMNYTSGTTGLPKGVRRPLPPVDPDTVAEQYGMFLMLFGLQPNSDNVHLCCSPLYHTAVLNFSTYSLHMGHTVVMMHKWDPETMLRLSQNYCVTHSHMVPTQFHRLLSLPSKIKGQYDLSSYTHMIHSAAPCPIDTKQQMLDWWGPVVYEYYAASEGGGTLVTPQQWLEKPGTVGKPWPISQIRVLRDDQSECEPQEVGTVYIKMGDHQFEYHGDKNKTKEAWLAGFFTVGDAGFLDEDGYLFLCDRKSDMIISGGVNIYPAEIESAMIQCNLIQDVAVFGVPNDDWGEEVKAVVQLSNGTPTSTETAETILSFCERSLGKYKCPRSIDFSTNMPRDPNGKMLKRKLRDPYWTNRDRQI